MFDIDYIFDFDCTITYRNFAYFWSKPDDIFKQLYSNIDNDLIDDLSYKFNHNKLSENIVDQYRFNKIIFGSQQRIEDLDNLFEKLSKKGNIIISSRGNADKIFECLKLNQLEKYFTRSNIYGTETNKTELIKYRLDMQQSVFYIDDNHKEHNDLLSCIKLGWLYSYHT